MSKTDSIGKTTNEMSRQSRRIIERLWVRPTLRYILILATYMSHLKERSESNCLNCGTQVAGRYCQHCGQENVEVKESIWHLLMHFIEDLTHFDGKLWKTLKLLLLKPASLTKHYMDGKRATYLHPIRMYLFVSAVFFLVVFTDGPSSPAEIKKEANAKIAAQVPKQKLDSALKEADAFKLQIGKDTLNYTSIEAYNAAQKSKPISKRDNWFVSLIAKQAIHLNQKYKGDKFEVGKALIEQFQHYFSRILYISLPIFAFFVWVLYRRNKAHFFVDHLIFSIHIYCAFFIILFVVKIIDDVYTYFMHKPFTILDASVALVLLFYLYKSLRNHFHQSRLKTIFKFLILNILTLLLMSSLMIAFLLLSLFNI